jgi:hypothetical protein
MARTQTQPQTADDNPSDIAYGAATVTVACKLPNGVWLQLHEMVEHTEPSPNGPRQVKMARKVGKPVLIKGYKGFAFDHIEPRNTTIIGGFALTKGVPRDFFEKWCEQNQDSFLLKNQLMFAHVEKASVDDFAKGNESVKNGFEPIDPDNPNTRMGSKKDGHIKLEKANLDE